MDAEGLRAGADLRSFFTMPMSAKSRSGVIAAKTIPETLQRRMALFAEGGRFLRNEGELFPSASWVAVMLGQNVIPRAIDPAIVGMPISEIEPKLDLLRRAMNAFADSLPSHEESLRGYCASQAA